MTKYGLIIGSGWDNLASGNSGTELDTDYGVPSAPVRKLKLGGTPSSHWRVMGKGTRCHRI